MRTTTLIATVVPLGRRGHYSVYLGDRMLLSASRTPLLDAARELMRIGNDPDAFLVMRRLSAGMMTCVPGRRPRRRVGGGTVL